jgi:hypothetical protein
MRTRQQHRTPDRPGRPVSTPERDARESLITAATELTAAHGVAANGFSTIAKRYCKHFSKWQTPCAPSNTTPKASLA